MPDARPQSSKKQKQKNKNPTKVAERKQESRHQQWWYPMRCEVEGCAVLEDLKKCSACNMVQYCCKEHQADDWKLHKQECKVFQRIGARATFYVDADMLQRCPLKPQARWNKHQHQQQQGSSDDSSDEEGEGVAVGPIPRGSSCQLCNKKEPEVPLTRTSCCQQVICDTTSNYQLMSYSREYCERSHERYTLCGYHGVEKACQRDKDWRECKNCIKKETRFGDVDTQLADAMWRGLNPYNYVPLLSKDVPRHSLCETCGKCGGKFICGAEGGGAGAGGKMVCLPCAASGMDFNRMAPIIAGMDTHRT